MTKNEKRKFDSLAIMYDRAWKSFDKRRDIEWKTNYAIWGALAIINLTVIAGQIDITIIDNIKFKLIGLFIIIISSVRLTD